MCGRYVLVSKIEKIEKKFNLNQSFDVDFKPSSNISAGDRVPVISDLNKRQISLMTFGFTPFWAQKPMYQINARSEGDFNKENNRDYRGAKGIINKAMFRASIRSKRCLVPADAFIEGPSDQKLSKPYLIYPTNFDGPFAFAGIWDQWIDKSSGEILDSFAIITTTANGVTAAINHHRAPLILNPTDWDLWLSNSASLSDISSLMLPFDGVGYNAYPISNQVKNPANKDLSLLQPTGQRVFEEFDYFITDELKLQGMGNRKDKAKQSDLFSDLD